MEKFKNNIKGITLVTLVVTIIILLILAGITISSLTNTGLFGKAKEAKEKTEIANQKDLLQIILMDAQLQNNFNKDYLQEKVNEQFGKNTVKVYNEENGNFSIIFDNSQIEYKISNNCITKILNWKEIMKNSTAPESQKEERNNNVIGLGTDGVPVNMDLWEYSYDTVTNGFALNSSSVLQNSEYNPNGTNTETIRAAGYTKEIENGKIDGTIPQYISTDSGKSYTPVTSLYRTFLNKDTLLISPTIPNTVVNMYSTFENCSNLNSVYIPDNVTNLDWTFGNCINMIETPIIPQKVKSMVGTFCGCTELKTASTIPESVISCQYTFMSCSKLTGNLIVNANIKNKILNNNEKDTFCFLYNACTESNCNLKLYGSCTILDNIVTSLNNPHISLGN